MELSSDDLRWRCSAAALGFATTDDLEDVAGVLGQDRAVEAIRFGMAMPQGGYNIYALGPEGLNKHSVVRHHLESDAAAREAPADYCYVNNFDEPHRPRALKLPAGRGAAFKRDMDRLVDDLRDALRAAFESDEYRTRRQMLERELKERQEEVFTQVEQEAGERNLSLQRTPAGFVFAPVREGKLLTPEDFHNLPAEAQQTIRSNIEHMENRLQETLQQMPDWVRQSREKLRKLNEETASYAVGHMIEALRRQYDPLSAVLTHLDRVKENIIENVDMLLATAQQQDGGGHGGFSGAGGADGYAAALNQQAEALLRRYRVNLVVDNAELDAAPVVYEDEPSYDRLVGRIEHRSEMGTLTTDFLLIRPGALHRANGGYLMVDARKVLTRPLAWEALKRALRAREARIESPYQLLGLLSTTTLEPEPIPLDVKIVLVGERMVYYLLCEYDPEFAELFKVAADFDERTERNDGSLDLYGRMIATLVRENRLSPFSAAGVGRVLEHAARLAGDREKLSVEVETVADLLREADYHARESGANPVGPEAVEAAIRARERRLGRVREAMAEEIRRETILIETEGSTVGQVNALSVLALGGYAFARPTRVTARAGLGRGNVVDIEREVDLGGPIHSKGVLILNGFLMGRFAREEPMSLSASLVFEQSYSGVEGDSASLAELLALLSVIAEAPLRQDLAVTGSVNQHGAVQPIGGVNEKIEGFFDVCAERSLTGTQGVVVPRANMKHLMLRPEVLEAVEAGRFHVYAVSHADEAAELFTGVTPGEADERGRFPPESLNGRVQARLEELARKRRRRGRAGSDSDSGSGSGGIESA